MKALYDIFGGLPTLQTNPTRNKSDVRDGRCGDLPDESNNSRRVTQAGLEAPAAHNLVWVNKGLQSLIVDRQRKSLHIQVRRAGIFELLHFCLEGVRRIRSCHRKRNAVGVSCSGYLVYLLRLL